MYAKAVNNPGISQICNYHFKRGSMSSAKGQTGLSLEKSGNIGLVVFLCLLQV